MLLWKACYSFCETERKRSLKRKEKKKSDVRHFKLSKQTWSKETIRLIRDGKNGGKGEITHLSLHCHHQNDSCIKMGSDESHFNVLLIVRDKVARQCPQTTTFEEKGERPKRIRTEVPLLTSLLTTLPLGQTGSHSSSCCARNQSPSIFIYTMLYHVIPTCMASQSCPAHSNGSLRPWLQEVLGGDGTAGGKRSCSLIIDWCDWLPPTCWHEFPPQPFPSPPQHS